MTSRQPRLADRRPLVLRPGRERVPLGDSARPNLQSAHGTGKPVQVRHHADTRIQPAARAAAIPESGTRNEALVGTVVWDGKAVPRSVAKVFGGLCEDVDDVAEYYLAVNLGVAWELDEELMRRHGLQYSQCFLTYVSEKDKRAVGSPSWTATPRRRSR